MRKYNTSIYVIEDYKLVMIGVPKVAQTSMKKAFIGGNPPNPHAKDALPYIHCYEVKEYAKKGYFIAMFVRNPYDRFVSFYKQKVATPNKFARRQNNPFITGMSFKDAVFAACQIEDSLADQHFRQQWAMVEDTGIEPDFIGKLEYLKTDWERLGDILGKKLPDLGKENSTASIPSPMWTPQLKQQIRARYQKDFRRLGYVE